MQKSQRLLLENIKPFIPGNWLEGAPPAESRKINAQDAASLAGSPDNGRMAAARFDPLANLVVISGAGGAPLTCATAALTHATALRATASALKTGACAL